LPKIIQITTEAAKTWGSLAQIPFTVTLKIMKTAFDCSCRGWSGAWWYTVSVCLAFTNSLSPGFDTSQSKAKQKKKKKKKKPGGGGVG
jgi:hypothetical protein